MQALNFRTIGYHNSLQFMEGFSESQPTVGYVLIGRNTKWNDADTPPALNDTSIVVYDTFNSMIAGKRVVGSDIALVIPRFDWISGTVYTAYDDQANSASFFSSANGNYVITDTLSVYRCVDNSNGSPSIIKPTGDYSINHGFIRLADGYVWKYMYRIPLGNRFITPGWIPAPTNQGPAYFGNALNIVPGTISRIAVEDGGTGYDGNTIIKIVGNGSSANAIANISGGNLVGCNVQIFGSGYTYQNCNVMAVGTGTGANLRAVLSPVSGHAFNPALELGANTVMVSCRIGHPDASENGKVTIQNDFRQVSLLMAPHKYNQNVEISSSNANSIVTMTSTILVTSGGPYSRDEIVYQGADLANSTYRATVVDYSVNNIFVNEQHGTIQVGIALKGNTSTVSRIVADLVPPELKFSSGELVFVANLDPVMRTENQAENIKFIISF